MEEETFDEYVTRLKTLSEDCEFGELRNSMIKDSIIIGIRDKKLQERLLCESDINREQVCKRGQANEATKQQDLIKYCRFCSGTHNRGNCPAWGKLCNNCGKRGHFKKCCSYRQNPSRLGSNRQNSHVIYLSDSKLINWKTDQIHLQTLILNSSFLGTIF